MPALNRADVPYTLDMTAAQVANQVAAAMDRVFSVSAPVLVPPVGPGGAGFLRPAQINSGETFTVNGKSRSSSPKPPPPSIRRPTCAQRQLWGSRSARQHESRERLRGDRGSLHLSEDGTTILVPGVDAIILGKGPACSCSARRRQAKSRALGRPFGQTNQTDDPKNFTSSKVDGNLIHVIGQSVVSNPGDSTHAGPLPYEFQLPGDQFAVFASSDPSKLAENRGQGE